VARRPSVVSLDEQDHEPAVPELEPMPAWSRTSVGDVRAALEEIDPDFRRVYEMHVFEHRPYDEIARTLGIQRLTVGSRLTRARQRLRAILCRRLGEDGAPQ
jgi:RNA polymerase sigma-70 factor (ECF subfamily)